MVVKGNPCKLHAWETRTLQGVQVHSQVSNHPSTPSLLVPRSELQYRHLTTSVPVQPSLGSHRSNCIESTPQGSAIYIPKIIDRHSRNVPCTS